MKLVTYQLSGSGEARLGWYQAGWVMDVQLAGAAKGRRFPSTMLELLQADEGLQQVCQVYAEWLADLEKIAEQHPAGLFRAAEVSLLAPLTNPGSFRDFYAFEQHVKTARAIRGLEMIPEWYELPVFYFSNHRAIQGPEAVIKRPAKTRKLDFELEVACVIGRQVQDVSAEEAVEYVAGYMILNDWSARDIQREEMKVGLGPTKGKDFATSTGPWLVTPDELEDRMSGKGFDLEMTARINGELVSRGNFKDLYWSFGEMIARASADTILYPGDLIGSGTVGTGCILELGEDRVAWLEPGDVVELEIERLGVLRNKIG